MLRRGLILNQTDNLARHDRILSRYLRRAARQSRAQLPDGVLVTFRIVLPKCIAGARIRFSLKVKQPEVMQDNEFFRPEAWAPERVQRSEQLGRCTNKLPVALSDCVFTIQRVQKRA